MIDNLPWCREREAGRCGSLALPGYQTCFFHLPARETQVLLGRWRQPDRFKGGAMTDAYTPASCGKCGHGRRAHSDKTLRCLMGFDQENMCACAMFQPVSYQEPPLFPAAHTQAASMTTYTPSDDTYLLEDVERIIETHSPSEVPDACICGWRWSTTDLVTSLDNHIAREVLKALPAVILKDKKDTVPTVDDNGHLVDEDGNCNECDRCEQIIQARADRVRGADTLCTRCLHSPRYHRANGDCTYVNLNVSPPQPCPCGPSAVADSAPEEACPYTLWTAYGPLSKWTPRSFPTVAACLQYLLKASPVDRWRVTKEVRVVVGGDVGCEDEMGWATLEPPQGAQ